MVEHGEGTHVHTEQHASGPGAVGIGRDNTGVVVTGSCHTVTVGASFNYRESLRLRLREIAWLQFHDLDRVISVLLTFPATEVMLHEQRMAISSMVHLVETICYPGGEEAHQNIQVLEETLDRSVVRAHGIKYAHLRDIFCLLHRARIGREDSKKAYGLLGLDSAFYRMPHVQEEEPLLAAIIDQLSTCPIHMPDHTHPLLEFVRLFLTTPLLARTPGIQAEHDNLRSWIRTVAQELHIPDPLSQSWHDAPQDVEVVLLIRVETDMPIRKDIRAVRHATFRLTAWVGSAQDFADGHPSPVGIPQTCSLAEIPHVISALIGQTSSGYSHVSLDTIEVMLPWYLLLHTVDQCDIPKGMFSSSLCGAEHHTVVRIGERVQPPYREQLRNSWKSKWDTYQQWSRCSRTHQLQRQIHHTDQEDVACVLARLNSTDCHPTTIQKRLNQRHVFGLVHAFVLGKSMTGHNATDVLLESMGDTNRMVVEKLVDTGIPIAMCIRGTVDTYAHLLNDLEHILTKHPLPEVSGVIKAYRNDALDARETGNLDHLGLHLTLLWDDPERLPPDSHPFQDADL